MKHGGDLISYKDSYDGQLIDFSSNINPLGPPAGLKDFLFDNFQQVESYPDIKYRSLKENLATYLGVDFTNVLVGNGAMEIIDLFNLLASRVITTSPAFSEYKLRAKVHGKDYLELEYAEDFKLDYDSLEKNIREKDLIILGNPNNPTGLRIEKDLLIKIYNLVRSRGAYLVLDEAFYEFAPEDYDSIEIFSSYAFENVGIIRAATKFFALPGLRLGYGCVSEEMRQIIEKSSLTWSVNSLAALAGEYIFKDQDYINRSKKYLAGERDFLLKKLSKIDGIKAYKTHTNYILIKLLNKSEDEVFQEFLKYGIVVRKCSSFKSLGNNHIRIAIKDRENNEKILEAFTRIDF